MTTINSATTSKTMKPNTFIYLTILTSTLLFASCMEGEKQETRTTATTEQGDLTFRGVYYGELNAAESVDVHVPEIPQTYQVTVESVLDDGSKVEKGDVLLTFVKETLELDLRDDLEKLEVARAERRKVLQQLEKERIDLSLEVQRKELALERAKLQVVEGVNLISQLELDKAKLDVQTAELELELAKKALKTFQNKKATALKIEDLKIATAERSVDERKSGLELIEVQAPVAGVVYAPYTRLNWQRTKVAPGVVARPGDKILEIPDLSKYHIDVYVRQRDAAMIKVGNEAIITPIIMPEKRITGKVIKKEEFATTRNERLGTETAAGELKEYLVKVEMDEAPESLRPGNSAKVEIISNLTEEQVLNIPVMYVQRVEDKDEAWQVELADGSFKEVKLGRTNLTHVQILEGLSKGDKVVLPAID